MTTFAQPPNTTAPGVPQGDIQDKRSQQHAPAQYAPQPMPSHLQAAPNMQPYPMQSQPYQPVPYLKHPGQAPISQRFAVPIPANEPTASESYYGQQLRPSLDPRHSHASFRSARSHRSTHSTDSHRSAHSARSYKSSHSHKSHRSHHSANDEIKNRRKKRELDARPTIGDSVMLVVNHFRDLLSGDRR